MAAPIAHIFLAIQMLAGPFLGLFNEKEFIIGTSFPDIRYLKVVERAETHFSNVTIEDILHEKNSFRAGMLFHSFVDEQREAYVVAHGFYKKIPTFRFTTQTLKWAEDEILKSYCDTVLYQTYFDEIIKEEMQWGIHKKHILVWHHFLREYCKGTYSSNDLIMKFFDLNAPNAWRIARQLFSWVYAKKMQQVILDIMNDKYMRPLIVDFYLNFSHRYMR